MEGLVFWEPSVLGPGVVGDRVVRARAIKAGVEGADVAVVGVEGASVLGDGVVGDRVVVAEVVVAGVEGAGVYVGSLNTNPRRNRSNTTYSNNTGSFDSMSYHTSS